MENHTDDIKLNIHPLLKMFENEVLFFIAAYMMMAKPAFQKSVVNDYAGRMGEITTSIKFNGFNTLKVDIAYIFNEFNATFNVSLSEKDGKERAGFGEAFNQHGRLVAIALFNVLESSTYNKSISKTEIFRFVKHLRNGAAHHNKFNFDGKIIKDTEWRGKVVRQDDEGNQVFGKFISLQDLLILINDVSDKLDEIDKRNINKMRPRLLKI